jgi:uncharacterized protein (TIGR02996 family)
MNELFQRILDEPDDLDARRVYADWLMDRGDPRGEYIVAATRLAENPDDEALADEVAAREVALGPAVRGEAKVEWRQDAGILRGGFLDEVDLRGERMAMAPHLFATAPITTVIANRIDELLPYASRLRRISVDDLEHLPGDWPRLRAVRAQTIANVRLPRSVVDLDLGEVRRGLPPGVLLSSLRFNLPKNARFDVTRVIEMPLSRLDVSGRDARSLVPLITDAPPSLRELTLRFQHDADEIVTALKPLLRRLEKLSLHGPLGPRVVTALAAREAPELVELRLQGDVGPVGAAALGAASFLPQLRHLGIRNGNLGERGVTLLAAALPRTHLSSLVLAERPYDGFAALLAALPPTVRALDIGEVIKMDALGESHLELRRLSTQNRGSDVAPLLSTPPFAKLRRLDAPKWNNWSLVDALLARQIQHATVNDTNLEPMAVPWANLEEAYGLRLHSAYDEW